MVGELQAIWFKKIAKFNLNSWKLKYTRKIESEDAIFCFHGFTRSFLGSNLLFQTPRHELKVTLKVLSKYYQFVSLDELLGSLDDHPGRRPRAAFTIDDGFSSILDVIEIFKKYNITPTVFICPELIDKKTVPFPEIIRIAVLLTKNTRVPQEEIVLGNLKDKLEYINHLVETFKKFNGENLAEELDVLISTLNVSKEAIVSHQLYDSLLDWSELASLNGDVQIGSHTCNHYHLSSLDEGLARDEIFLSKKMIQDQMKVDCRYFCYPFGGEDSFSEREINLVEKAGYDYSFSILPGRLNQLSHRYKLPRYNGLNSFMINKG